MKTIGFIGGLTWHLSVDYYRLFNQLTNDRLGGVSSCEMMMYCNDLKQNGAEGVVPGRTEIPLLIKQRDISVPAFDTTLIHTQAAVNFVLNQP